MVLVVSITITLPSSTNTFLHLLSPQHPASIKNQEPFLQDDAGTPGTWYYQPLSLPHNATAILTHTQSNQQSGRRLFPAGLCSSSTLLFLHLTSSHQPRATFETRNRTINNEQCCFGSAYQTRFLHSILSSRLLLLLPTGSLK